MAGDDVKTMAPLPRYEAFTKGLNTLAYEPTEEAGLMKRAEFLFRAKQVPERFETWEEVAAAALYGRELGLTVNQSMQHVFVIHGAAGLSTDMMAGLVMRSDKCEFLVNTRQDPQGATYRARRRDWPEDAPTFEYTFTVEMAMDANLLNQPRRPTWQTNRAAMLRHRALGHTVRTVFPDVVFGLYTRDELDDIGQNIVRPPDRPRVKSAVVNDVPKKKPEVDASPLPALAEEAAEAPERIALEDAPAASIEAEPVVVETKAAEASPQDPPPPEPQRTKASKSAAKSSTPAEPPEAADPDDPSNHPPPADEAPPTPAEVVNHPLTGESVTDPMLRAELATLWAFTDLARLLDHSARVAELRNLLADPEYRAVGWLYADRRQALGGKPMDARWSAIKPPSTNAACTK